MSKEHLEHRAKLKAKKPSYTRQDSHKKSGLAGKWRRPRGIQSKMRLKKKGYKSSPSLGWRSPKDVRGLSKDGLVPINVSTIKEAKTLNAKTSAAIVSGKIGNKKRAEIIELLLKNKIAIINLHDPQNTLETIKKKFEEKVTKKKEEKEKEEKKKKDAQEKKKKEEEKKKQEAKKKEDEPKSDDQKKTDKKELDKVLSNPKA